MVTGGAGFIGSQLVERLLHEGSIVRVADNLSRGSIDNLSHLMDRIDLVRVDLTDKDNCVNVCSGIDYVFHLAASVGGIHYIKKENVGGSTPSILMNTNMLEASRICDIKKFLFASSACVYREKSLELNRFVEEDAYPANPETTYGWAKLLGEIQCRSYSTDYGISTCSARIFNAFGDHESLDPKSAHVVPSLVRKAIAYPGEPFSVFGDGKQERAFIYVKDCVEGLMRFVERLGDGSAVNLGSKELVSIGYVAQQIVAMSGKDIEVQYDPSGPQGTHRYCADTTRMEQALDWRPKTSFLTGLKYTYDWARRQISVAA